ncbi:MAG: putative peptide maturation dehydrogenase [Proteobacteria bacterium]|uniref:putative peptide maturation dehydrogenase n=1 Tax=Rudaea sp. TaxID=2136325 RepID=UPI00321F9078|nr:putative peptide maturation dehydrogenase [Pseudomonadota bacterium]
MRVRRCGPVMLEPRERLEFNLSALAAGGSGLSRVLEWIALAPHREGEVELTPEEAIALGTLSPSAWVEFDELAQTHSRAVLDALLEKKLLVTEAGETAQRDQKLRDTHWRTPSAVMHYASRWAEVDTEGLQKDFAEMIGGRLIDRLGPPAPVVRERAPATQRLRLPRKSDASTLDVLLDSRVTCRNFDRSRKLPLEQFSAVLYRAYGARSVDETTLGIPLLKKGVPAAGALHATEAYLIVQHVEGVEPGLYHYHPVEHALEPMRKLDPDAIPALIKSLTAAQEYFADAHVVVIATSRFFRNFWKYRNHSKAYRALILDVGHLSQTLYLAATELGLGAFVTAVINEIDIERTFGLDPLEEGPLAVNGFGIRAPELNEAEFDPLNAVWAAQTA